ncbi:DUF4105 domain-containing protein [Kushneria phosphatilytica]|uniref:DUF4105 domain-containing protein n=1 Tax=Kushneria phosphatilytica TaxID=657387 RepID=A0A1S1NTC5_9GAMM|nr:DUF4105 domain-containing protein [Kushneria phosphatilytica]OHV08721.1 hypothetical protein BH688_11900 [Kushneria phosphatilytica]QEL12444.1 DUF4105 domain-containing protein [Kushneria phosphatilytica]
MLSTLLFGLLRLLLALAVLIATAWGCGALWFQLPGPVALRFGVITLWCTLALATMAGISRVHWQRLRRWSLAGYLAALFALLGWWQTITPHNDRDWAPDVARQLTFERQGSHITLHNVRNFEWRTLDDFTPRWETREYDLDRLRSVDMLVSYWMGPAIAHTLVSFGFSDGRYLTFSVEIRRERNEDFSTFGGFFREFELSLIAADERDIVRTRTNMRGESVYLYRVGLPQPAMRQLMLAYLDTARELRDHPEFYNTLTSNCTTLVFDMLRPIVPGLPLDYRLLLSGYLPGYVYDLGGLDTSRPLATLHRLGHINARARASDIGNHAATDFSRAIRRGVPAADGTLIAPPASH